MLHGAIPAGQVAAFGRWGSVASCFLRWPQSPEWEGIMVWM